MVKKVKKKPTRKKTKRIRLGCWQCDRDDFDGINKLPKDWEDIERLQSCESSIKEGVESLLCRKA